MLTPGRHDFDPLNLRLYGQYHYDPKADTELPTANGWDQTADVSVGRVSCYTATEAQQFVDKLISYERLQLPQSDLQPTSAAPPLDASYLNKIVYIASSWWHPDTPGSADSSVVQKEALRTQMRSWFPAINKETRSYEDKADSPDPGSIADFNQVNVWKLVQEGPHFLSLTGHGWYGGYCTLSSQMPLTGIQSFVAYANSCSTADPDNPGDPDHCQGEAFVLAKGGAIAYVGNGAMSGTDGSNNFEESFWCALRAYGRAGPAANARIAANGWHSQWESFMKAYYGCPEMPVWIEAPKVQVLAAPAHVLPGAKLQMWVGDGLGHKIENITVTVLAGWNNDTPDYLASKQSAVDGTVSFQLPSNPSFTKLTAVAAADGYQPYICSIAIST